MMNGVQRTDKLFVETSLFVWLRCTVSPPPGPRRRDDLVATLVLWVGTPSEVLREAGDWNHYSGQVQQVRSVDDYVDIFLN